MTEQPPVPPGTYPAPPHSGAVPQEAYTEWVTRVLAFIIDFIPYAVIVGIGYGIEAGTQETACVADTSGYNLGQFCATGNSPIGVAAFSLSIIVGLAYIVWNYGYKQGTTGSSLGKSMMKFKVVSEQSRQPIGFGMSIVRQLAHAVDAAICYIGYLFPLWDAKRQTIADKIIGTVCLPIN